MRAGFPPIASSTAKILILGSMPGEESLRRQQYYGYSRNSFWFIMENLFQIELSLPYDERRELLKKEDIALWDVIATCKREGSLDSAIDNSSIVANDFLHFLKEHPFIKVLFFNGAKAESEYNKRVLPVISRYYPGLKYHRLPSTSPAMAMLTKEEKLEQWKIITKYL